MSLAGMLAVTLLVFSMVAPDRVPVPRNDGGDRRPGGRCHQGRRHRPGGRLAGRRSRRTPGHRMARPRIPQVRPFLLLSSRAEDEAAEGEYEAFLRVTGLPSARLRRVRME